MGPRENVG